MMDFTPELRHGSEEPLYRQLYDQIARRIRSGELPPGEKLPATRELAGLLGLNRTTVSAAYEILESEGLITGRVGRGSFVAGVQTEAGRLNWSGLLERGEPVPAGSHSAAAAPYSFAMAMPSRALFPLGDFRASCAAVLERADLADILQLGSPSGYEPLRRRLLEESRGSGLAHPGDDLLITNGCQQALDLLVRVLLQPGDKVAVEDPVYPGLKNLLASAGVQLIAIPVGMEGADPAVFERAARRERPRLLIVTPNFQNPTGTTLGAAARRRLLEAARSAGVPVVENDPYGELRYVGQNPPAIKQMDDNGGAILLRSFSKISFPGLRVGWALAPKPLIDRMRQAKEACDLHTDQLSQATLLEFMESGRLEAHRARILEAGRQRLTATLESCAAFLPPGSRWTRPEGGMNIWVRLPEPLDASELLPRAREEGVTYLPGRYFAVARHEPGALRLSFASLEPEQIRQGLAILGKVAAAGLDGASNDREPASAMV